jgi:beta-phosphoglucomutase-like phosphatase (HAD superfamily)
MLGWPAMLVGMTGLRAVVFDLGETLVSEERAWRAWAQWLDVAPHTFFAALGAVIERGEDHRRVFGLLRPGFDLESETRAKDAAGLPSTFTADDVYPDAPGCLARLRAAGLVVGVAANQPMSVESIVGDLGLGVDVFTTSAR